MAVREAELLADMLAKLASKVRRLDDRELRDVLEGRYEISLEVGHEERPQEAEPSLSEEEIEAAVAALADAPTREAGQTVLTERNWNKTALIALARRLDLPVQRRDPNERIRDRIVEATIGYRLRSKAIQGQPAG